MKRPFNQPFTHRHVLDKIANVRVATGVRFKVSADFLGRWASFVEEHPDDQDYGLDQLDAAQTTLTTYADEARRWRTSFASAGGQLTDVPIEAMRHRVVARMHGKRRFA